MSDAGVKSASESISGHPDCLRLDADTCQQAALSIR
jgi:hypothetical protein